jgi:hypothetical protein
MVTLSATAVWDERRRRVWPRLGLVHGDLDIDPQGRVVRIAWRGRKGGVEFRFTDLGADVEQIRAPENALSAAGVLRSTLFGRE